MKKTTAEKQTIESPSGLDLKPAVPKAVRISKRLRIFVGVICVGMVLSICYGFKRSGDKRTVASRQSEETGKATPATQAAREFTASTPAGVAPLEARVAKTPASTQLVPPGSTAAPNADGPASCGADPQTNQPYRFDPQTGKPCSVAAVPTATAATARSAGSRAYRPGNAGANQAVANQALNQMVQAQNQSAQPQMTPQQQALLMEYKRLYDARMAGTAVKLGGPPASDPAVSAPIQSAALEMPGAPVRSVVESQKDKDTLQSRRTALASPYEIRAGWEIPGALEQDLNSDLAGGIKALVEQNVYDTATGKYLLIPQGSRLVGSYDSKVSFGQAGVQVAWNRLIYPDGSAIDLDDMAGLDNHGQAGFRDKVNNHYGRLFGQAALSSLFSFGLGFSQARNQSVLTYPSPTTMGESAALNDMMTTSSQITRRNLNIQPTVHIRAGYKFTVRVDRDIVFDAPYAAMTPGQTAIIKRDAQKTSQISQKGSR
jgi:type IV secretion system protein VirB10